ncbi:hypothetical protein NDU88_003965 [Pleurodeles waltl]|uniref:Uncharacterized protein n=1 Tax=Pleurodeles waltl TaxID=8319 RepID=A0AAV7L7A7_PLEWA|nr:hypothetical protein NDU88_003965 [Pleurodeles waltl]
MAGGARPAASPKAPSKSRLSKRAMAGPVPFRREVGASEAPPEGNATGPSKRKENLTPLMVNEHLLLKFTVDRVVADSIHVDGDFTVDGITVTDERVTIDGVVFIDGMVGDNGEKVVDNDLIDKDAFEDKSLEEVIFFNTG